MHKKWLLTLLLSSSILISGCTSSQQSVPKSYPAATEATSQPTPAPSSPVPTQAEFTARFEIYTNGTKRVFTDAKYHRQSADVYIQNPDPHVVHVKKSGKTWSDFFTTLPFSLKKDCLVTGTKQTFCNTDTKRLHFYLNDVEDPDALDKVIAPEDELRVEYR